MTRRIGMGFDWQGSMDRERALKRAQIADEVGMVGAASDRRA